MEATEGELGWVETQQSLAQPGALELSGSSELSCWTKTARSLDASIDH